MRKEGFREIKKLLQGEKNVVLTTHKSPDGDAIGSSLAIYHFLKKLGHNVKPFTPDEYPEFLEWMPGSENILTYDQEKKTGRSLLRNADIIFCLDYNSTSRTGSIEEELIKSDAKKIMIDHHKEPEDFADYYYINEIGSSTCELVYEFICELGHKDIINRAIAECIYAGIMTDTGSFKFSSTTSDTHRAIAEMIDKGVKGWEIHQMVHDNYSETRLRLIGYSLSEKLKVFKDYKTAVISLDSDELEKFNYSRGDTEGLVNEPLSIKDVVMSILVKKSEGLVKLSFRSKGEFSVNEFARENFNGGGHANAAGGISDLSVDETVEKIEQLLPQYEKELNR